MEFKPGKKKTGGRQKGTPNKKTLALAELFEKHGLNVPEQLVMLYKTGELSDKDKMNTLLELMTYIYPKRKAVDMDEQGNQIPEQTIVRIAEWGNKSESADEPGQANPVYSSQ